MASSPAPSTPNPFFGVLELHIIEAQALPGNRKLKADKLSPYVQCRLESKPKEKMTTVAAKPPAYRWGVTFTFPVTDLNDTLILDVKEKQTWSDIHRGTLRIPLTTFVPNELNDATLPLAVSEKKDALLGGRLHFEATLKQQAMTDPLSALSKSNLKSMVMSTTGSAPNVEAIGSIKIDDIGDINVIAPEGEYPMVGDPRGPTPYSFNPAKGVFEIPDCHIGGAFVLDRDMTEV